MNGIEIKEGGCSELRLIFDSVYATGVISLEFVGLFRGDLLASGKGLFDESQLSF